MLLRFQRNWQELVVFCLKLNVSSKKHIHNTVQSFGVAFFTIRYYYLGTKISFILGTTI